MLHLHLNIGIWKVVIESNYTKKSTHALDLLVFRYLSVVPGICQCAATTPSMLVVVTWRLVRCCRVQVAVSLYCIIVSKFYLKKRKNLHFARPEIYK